MNKSLEEIAKKYGASVRTVRQLIEREQRSFKNGKWGKWQHAAPKDTPFAAMIANASGWLHEVDQVYRNHVVAVLTRPVPTECGTVLHLAIRNYSETDIPWAAKQRIKNELCGKDHFAIEYFPTDETLVDEADMYHLWVLPAGHSFLFPPMLHEWRPSDRVPYGPE